MSEVPLTTRWATGVLDPPDLGVMRQILHHMSPRASFPPGKMSLDESFVSVLVEHFTLAINLLSTIPMAKFVSRYGFNFR